MTASDIKTAPIEAASVQTPVATASMFSPEAEKLLIATVLNEGKKQIAEQLLAKIGSNDFHIDEHAAIWKSVQSLHENQLGHDAVALIDHARGSRSFVGGAEYIFNLVEDQTFAIASDEAIQAASDRVKELSILRRLKQILTTGITLCETPGQSYSQILSLVEDDLLSLRKFSESGRAGPAHIRDGLVSLMDRMQRQQDGEIIGAGVTTGFVQVDEITSGFVDEDLIYIGARPSMGKTALLLNLAASGAKSGRPSLIFSLEMRTAALTQRLLGKESHVSLSSIRTGELREENWSRIFEGFSKLENMPIWIDDTPGLTMHEIRSRARTFVAQHGKCTIYIDYIQHIAKRDVGGGKQQDERQHVSEASRSLKGMARELRVPVVALSQLSRELEKRANKEPIMSDLRDSGSLEQDGDLIMFLYRDIVYNPDTQDPDLAKLIIAKQRDGAIGSVPLRFLKEIGSFQDYSY